MNNKFMKLGFLFVLSIITTFSVSSCKLVNGCHIKGKGDIVEKQISLDSFSSITINGNFNVILKQGEKQSVSVKGYENLIEQLDTMTDGNTWKIEYRDIEYSLDPITVYITLPVFKTIKINGDGAAEISSFSNLNEIDFIINGSGSITTDSLRAKSIESDISGSGDIVLKGYTESQNIEIAGSGNYESFGLLSQNTEVQIAGSGNVEVNVNSVLNVEVAGSGDVYYKGKPQINFNSSGSGEIISSNK